jgi:hypothetical protein
VSAGGEEFTLKLDRLLTSVTKDKKLLPVPRPKFMHGKMSEVVKKINSKKPFLLYLSNGQPGDQLSHIFEAMILT